MRALLILLSLLPMLAAADLKSQIDDLVSSTPALANGFVGMQVVSLTDGKVLYERNQDRLFVPASNMKLFTTALALVRLGPQYRFTTQIGADQPIDARGTLGGNLIFLGGGDPSLSGRAYPYQNHSTSGGEFSFHAVDELVNQLVARGLKRVDGDIVGDDRRYVWSPYADGWSFGDAAWEYGAPVSALIVDDNSFAVTIRPGAEAGDPAQISLLPPFEYLSIDNRIRTQDGGERRIDLDRKPGGRQLHLWGAIGMGAEPLTQLLAVDDPAVYAAEVLRDALIQRGIAIRGKAVARHRFADDASEGGKLRVVLAERPSPPLAQVLRVVDKVSQNLHAEVMLREVGASAKHFGSREAGLNEMRDFLTEIGVEKDDYRFSDGSGLSRSTLVTPRAITKLLAYMYQTSQRDTWMGLLPIAGVDGTLGRRFPDHPEAHAIRAKTGTLGHVRANSGYVDSPEYGPLAFSFIVNNYSAPTAEVSKFLDAVELAMLK
ncbi:MAG TPA: D-alanyl-D-alanine carboxypeptidase/D-alanyl-D-alanine-endopeptidase [Bryobacteraceae bacterium]|nr:D-alanyl-D-alanine carboxypeptidase/D-alanyl-D-alanine-endopeptidase [Bryobacteraceae bacterium]